MYGKTVDSVHYFQSRARDSPTCCVHLSVGWSVTLSFFEHLWVLFGITAPAQLLGWSISSLPLPTCPRLGQLCFYISTSFISTASLRYTFFISTPSLRYQENLSTWLSTLKAQISDSKKILGKFTKICQFFDIFGWNYTKTNEIN